MKTNQTISDINDLIGNVRTTIERIETQQTGTVAQARSAEDESALIDWATLDTRARFLQAYAAHLAGPAMDGAKARHIAAIRVQFDALLPEFETARREMETAQAGYGRLRERIRTNQNEATFIERTEAFEKACVTHGALQKRLLVMRDEIIALGGVVDVPL